MEYDVAKKINQIMIDHGAKLDQSIKLLDPTNKTEYNAYKLAIGKILAEMYLGIMHPIYLQYPDLKPKELD